MNNGISKARDADSGETGITLGVLTAVEGNAALSQRALAHDLGIALGLANAYLKRCAKKGWIKIKQVPPNRYAYYLTPTGFAEKSRLTAKYLSSSLTFFRRARSQCGKALEECRRNGWRRVALAGDGEIAEIAILCSGESGVEIVGVVHANGRSVAGVPVLPDLRSIGQVDAVVVTDVTSPQAVYDEMVAEIAPERVLAPKLLNISRSKSGDAGMGGDE